MRGLKAYLTLLVLFCALQTALAQDLASFEKRVHVKILDNGLTVLLLNRPQAPVFSFFTIVDAGDAQDPKGKTGLAHMMEHMAFKGTDEIGTTNFPAEKVALAKVEAAYAAYDLENNRTVNRDEKKVAELKAAWEKAREEADQYVVKNEFAEIIERNGGVGLNASTGLDSTRILLFAAGQPAGAVGLPGVGALPASGDARVLQGARRGDGGAAHAHRLLTHRKTGGAIPLGGL